MSTASAKPAATDPVQVAATDLPAGHALTAGDLVTAHWPRGARPAGGLSRPDGRILAAPLRRGEPLTDARVVGPGLLAGQPDWMVAVSVRLADPAGAAILRPGDRVDVFAAPAADAAAGSERATDTPEPLAAGALLLAVGPARSADQAGAAAQSTGGGLGALTGVGGSAGGAEAADRSGVLVVAVDRDGAARLAVEGAAHGVEVVLTGGSG